MAFQCFSANSLSAKRSFKEEPHSYRDEFARDRDRILYSKEFRRLSGKTQVFVVGYDDHVRTRLTHTLEVAQIAKTISQALGLNIVLSEAIALAHDVGHTPFGHVGERTLNLFMNGCDRFKDFNTNLPHDQLGFKHNWQGVRVVTSLEKLRHNFFGLNLTDYTLWGILHHSSLNWKPCDYLIDGNCNMRHINSKCPKEENNFKLSFYDKYMNYISDTSWTVEGFIVKWADEIAQRHHDIEDGLEARIIDKDELIMTFKEIFGAYLDHSQRSSIEIISKEKNKWYYLPLINKLIIDFYVTRFLEDLTDRLDKIKKGYEINTNEDFERAKATMASNPSLPDLLGFEQGFYNKDYEFQDFLSARILNSHLAQSMDGKSNYILRQSIKAYLTNPQQLPDETIYVLYSNLLSKTEWERLINKSFAETIGILRNQLKIDHSQNGDVHYRTTLSRIICDYISGMTDQYALQRYEILYGTKNVLKI